MIEDIEKYIVYDGKLYSEYKNKIISYKNKTYYENSPTVRVGDSTLPSKTVVKFIQENHPERVAKNVK